MKRSYRPFLKVWTWGSTAVVLVTGSFIGAVAGLGGGTPTTRTHGQTTPPPALPAASTAEAPAGLATDPLIGPIRKSDVLSVQVVGEPVFSGDHRVDSGGTITLPLIGQVKLTDQMPSEAASNISTALKKMVRNPQVVVRIISRPILVRTAFISGAVNHQGRLTIKEGTRLNEILEPAGILPSSDLKRVTITRGEQKLTIDYLAFRSGNNPDEANNPLVQDEDKIYISAQVQVTGMFKVSGEVKSPQTFNLPAGTTAFQAIQQAGGITPEADLDHAIIKRNGSSDTTIPLREIQKGNTEKDVALQDKDEIFIPRLEKPVVFTVTGGVMAQGQYPLLGRTTLQDAMAAARGPMDRVDMRKVALTRAGENGQMVTKTYDLTKDADRSIEVKPGDYVGVPFPTPPKAKTTVWDILGKATSLMWLFGGR